MSSYNFKELGIKCECSIRVYGSFITSIGQKVCVFVCVCVCVCGGGGGGLYAWPPPPPSLLPMS